MSRRGGGGLLAEAQPGACPAAVRAPLGTATSVRRTAPSFDEDLLLRGLSASTRRLPLSIDGNAVGGWLMSARARAWARLEELRLLRSTAQMKLVPVGLKQLSKPRRCAPTLASYEQHLPQLEQQPSARRQHRSRRPSAGPSTPHGRRSSRADQPRRWSCDPRVAQQAQDARRQTRRSPSAPVRRGGQSAAGQEPEHRRAGRAVHPRRSAGGFAAYSERLAAAHPAAGSSRYGPHVFTCALQLARLHCMCTS